MAASDATYLAIVEDVNDALDALGTTYTVRAKGTYDSATLSTSPGAERTVTGLVADAELMSGFAGALLPAESLAWVAKRALLLSPAANPQSGESIQVDGRWFSMDKIKTLKPADITLLYILDVSS